MLSPKAPHATDKYVGARIRMRRLTLGMTQTQLGHALGLTFQQVQKYEKGTNRVSASRLQEIARVLHVPAAFFFQENVPHGPTASSFAVAPDVITDFMTNRDGIALMKAFTLIADRKLRRLIVGLVQQMAESL